MSSLPLCWFHGGVIFVTSCHQTGDVVASPLSPSREYGGVTLVTGLGTWWDYLCPDIIFAGISLWVGAVVVPWLWRCWGYYGGDGGIMTVLGGLWRC